MAKKILGKLMNQVPVNDTVAQLIRNSDKFDAGNPFPIESVRVKRLISRFPEKRSEIAHNAESAYPLVHEDVLELMVDFLDFKRKNGSQIEKSIYKDMTIPEFVNRLFMKRPMVFCGSRDVHLLRGNDGKGTGGFEAIGQDGKERAPRLMKNYISYDEMKISALLGCSTFTLTINKGDRNNLGVPESNPDIFESKALIIGLVGPRLHKSKVMERQEIIVKDPPETGELSGLFANLYGVSHFPHMEEASQKSQGFRALNPGGSLFNEITYKRRIRLSAEMFLREAGHRAAKCKKKAYVHVVGLGLGVWQVLKEQEQLFVDVFGEVIQDYDFSSNISDLDFSWIPVSQICGVPNGGLLGSIRIHFSKRDFFQKLKKEDSGKLLVVSWAFDGNSFPGNEFWMESLNSSGDPQAACSTQITELLNPYINKHFSGASLRVASNKFEGIFKYEEFQEMEKSTKKETIINK